MFILFKLISRWLLSCCVVVELYVDIHNWSPLHSLKALRNSVLECSSFKSGEDLGPGMHCHSKAVRAYALERLDVQKR